MEIRLSQYIQSWKSADDGNPAMKKALANVVPNGNVYSAAISVALEGDFHRSVETSKTQTGIVQL